jgi:hypothetical protein
VKRLFLLLATTLLLVGALSTLSIVRADGDPKPSCPTNGFCKP